MTAEIKKIEEILGSGFLIDNYVSLIEEIFSAAEIVAPYKKHQEFSNFSSHIMGYTHVANYETPEDEKLIIVAVELQKNSYVENARSTQRSYAKKLIESSNSDAAVVAFFTEDDPKWRLSFVRLDYEMKFENGKLQAVENITPAKRYSFLVGADEPSHTAIDRLHLFITDKNAQPTLDDLEEVFSVEKVTKEFFDLYCEKYHQLREHLLTNEDFLAESEKCGFSAEQFAKKLMGQIVFLYFLQKKGWLGVGAWPNRLTEKEYKNVFYTKGTQGRIIKEYIPQVYVQQGEEFVFQPAALYAIPNDAEELIANNLPQSKVKNWGEGSKHFLRTLFDFFLRQGGNFHNDYLEPLFYNALNKNRGPMGYSPLLHCRIPFLSGGLFEPIKGYDWEISNFCIPDEIFSNRIDNDPRTGDGILDIFDRYNFTMSEDEPMEREVAIDPEMLGKVFENLLDVTDRKSKGAFYTPREIVHYMCQESLINYLTTATGLGEQDIRDFILYGDFMKDEDTVKEKRLGNGAMYISEEIFKIDEESNVVVNRLEDIDDALADIRIADPAVGSGAFPVGMLNEIVRARQNLTEYLAVAERTKATSEKHAGFLVRELRQGRSTYDLKWYAIKNSIFAADIEPSAVDIAQLRLWLSLVIDDEINPEATSILEGHRNPLPLPNLECNILCGNSLVDEFEGYPLLGINAEIGTEDEGDQYSWAQSEFDAVIPKILATQDAIFVCDDPIKKAQLLEELSALQDNAIETQLTYMEPDVRERYEESKASTSRPYILWQLEFARVFRDKGGFDVVIGNPPYVDSEEMTKHMPEMRETYTKIFSCAKGNWDLFVIFIEKGLTLCSKRGCLSFIVPNKLISAPYAESIRKYIAKNELKEIRDYSNVAVFKSAAVYPVVFRVKTSNQKNSVIMNVMDGMNSISSHNEITEEQFYVDTNWDKYFNTSMEALAIVEKMEKFSKLSNISSVNGAATVNEAYLIKEFMYDGEPSEDVLKFINTGGIDRYKSYYGLDYIRYLKGKYLNPVVKKSDIEDMSSKRLEEALSDKIIIGGMTKVLECYYDNGQYLAGKSTIIVYNYSHLKYLLAVLNSRLMTFFYHIYYNSMSLAGGFYRVGTSQIKNLPIAVPSDEIIVEIEKLVDNMNQLRIDHEENDSKVVELNDTIDMLIYKVYGLSDKEISYIDIK